MWIYDELRSIHEISYRYDDESSPEDLVECLADELAPTHPLPADRLLDGSLLLFEYEPEKIQALLDTYFKPENSRIDLSSTLLGRSEDYEATEPALGGGPMAPSDELFDPTKGSPPPFREPFFGTFYWYQTLSDDQILEWSKLAEPQLPSAESMLTLPPRNHFVPQDFVLKELPAEDCDHPLLNCSIKLQTSVGKRKVCLFRSSISATDRVKNLTPVFPQQWFPATVTRYNSLKNQILLSYEDETEKWHKVDVRASDLSQKQLLSPDFQGTLDDKKVKYRIVALANEGERPVRRLGDENDFDGEDGVAFPPIPPPPLSTHLPKLVCNTQLLKLWHLQDRIFKRPIADFRVLLHCADANKTPLHAACADLLVQLVSDALTETAYLASVCELGSSLSASDGGFSIRVHGFHDKLMDLFAVVFDLIVKFKGREDGSLPDEIRKGSFDLCLQSYLRQCTNSGMKASKLASSLRVRCLRSTSWSSHEKVRVHRLRCYG